MPTKRNRRDQQPYVPAGHGDESGEYRDNAYGGNAGDNSSSSSATKLIKPISKDVSKEQPKEDRKEASDAKQLIKPVGKSRDEKIKELINKEIQNPILTKGLNKTQSSESVSSTHIVDNSQENYEDIKKQLAESTSHYRRKLSKFNEGDYATYDLETGEVVNLTSGYVVSFHTTSDKYTDKEYNQIVDDLTSKTKSKPHAGCYGRPEISYICKDEKTAVEIGKKYGQETVYDVVNNTLIKVDGYDETKNKIIGRNKK